jgi:hypothetical protein
MRLTIPAAYCSTIAGAWLISVRLGYHSVDTDWPWWAPWDALADPLGDERDGAHPTRTREAFSPLGAAENRPAPAGPR